MVSSAGWSAMAVMAIFFCSAAEATGVEAVWPLSACLSAGVQAARMAAAMMPNMELVYAVRGVMVGFLSLKGLNYSGFCMFL